MDIRNLLLCFLLNSNFLPFIKFSLLLVAGWLSSSITYLMFLLKCTPLKKERLWLQRSKWKISCRCGVGKERGQMSSCKDVACEAAVTVKLPGVHGDCHGWRTQKGLHNSSVTVIFWEQRSSCRDTIPAFMWFHLPWDSTKAQKQKPVIFLLCFQRLFMTVCSMPGLQPSA